jgi:hypothetical protein
MAIWLLVLLAALNGVLGQGIRQYGTAQSGTGGPVGSPADPGTR